MEKNALILLLSAVLAAVGCSELAEIAGLGDPLIDPLGKSCCMKHALKDDYIEPLPAGTNPTDFSVTGGLLFECSALTASYNLGYAVWHFSDGSLRGKLDSRTYDRVRPVIDNPNFSPRPGFYKDRLPDVEGRWVLTFSGDELCQRFDFAPSVVSCIHLARRTESIIQHGAVIHESQAHDCGLK